MGHPSRCPFGGPFEDIPDEVAAVPAEAEVAEAAEAPGCGGGGQRLGPRPLHKSHASCL